MSVKTCTSCKKQVYPVEEFKFSDHLFHKGCFRCTTCNLQLNIKNGKLSGGKPYCTTHYPTVHSFAVVSDTPEIQRVQKNMAIASQTQYKGQQDKKAEQERRRANMENPPAVPAKPTRQVGSIADFDPVAAEKTAHRGPPAGAGAVAASGTVVYSSASTPAPAAATPTPVPPAAAADGATATKSGYGRGGYGRSGATPAATGTAGQRSSAIDAPAAAPAASTVTEVQSVASRPTSVQQPTPVMPATSTPPPTLAAAQPPAPPSEPAPQPLAAGAGVRVSSQEVSSLSQDLSARLSMGTSGDRASLQAAAPVAEPVAPTPTPAPAAQAPAPASGQTYNAIYDYDATDEDEVSIQVGDIMTNPEQIDEGWMYATNQRTGKRGMLPSNYVELAMQ
jgi:hypothetical protein